MADDLRQRYADAIARWALMYPIPAWSLSEGERAEKLARNWGRVAAEAVLAVRDDELQRLCDELAQTRLTARVNHGLHRSAHEDAVQAEAAVARMDARHRPKQTGRWVSCSTHSFLSRNPDCPRCTGKSIWTCIQPGCKGWPCAEHLALQDEAEETCAHLADLDVPADGEQPPTPAEETDHA